MPRLAEGQALAAAGAHAMLDISDGLVADARHLAAASGVRLQIHAPLLPLGDGIAVANALTSGEEYELLAALAPDVAETLLKGWPTRFAGPLTVVGTVRGHEPGGAVDVIGADVLTGPVENFSGHDHFTG